MSISNGILCLSLDLLFHMKKNQSFKQSDEIRNYFKLFTGAIVAMIVKGNNPGFKFYFPSTLPLVIQCI